MKIEILAIGLFTNVNQIYGSVFPRDLVTSHFINLDLTMVFQYLESSYNGISILGIILQWYFNTWNHLTMVFQYLESSTLHKLVVATLDKPRTSFQVVRNNPY